MLLAAHNDDAAHRLLALPGSDQPLAVGLAVAADNPCPALGVCASRDNIGNTQTPPDLVVKFQPIDIIDITL
jgi:hypothetical protein